MPPARPLDGLVWPLVPNSKKEGDRSTTWANKQALAAAIRPVDDTLAEQVLSEPKWRQKYTKYVYKHVASCLHSKEDAVASSKAGLEWVHNNFEFVRDGKSMKLSKAMSSITGSFETGFLQGTKPRPAKTVLEVSFVVRPFPPMHSKVIDSVLLRLVRPRMCFRFHAYRYEQSAVTLSTDC